MSCGMAVVRIRGLVHIRTGVYDCFKSMGLTRKNHCTIIPDTKEYQGMIFKVKDYVSWGEIDDKTATLLLKTRGRIVGDKKLTDQYVKDNSKYSGIGQLASALSRGEAKVRDVKGLKPVFRLNPPRKGFERKGIKKPFKLGGALGYRGEKINALLERMT